MNSDKYVDRRSKSQLNWIMSALLVSIFLTQVDQTIVSTALPTIVSELNGLQQMSWVFTVYMLASTVMMPIAGKLSDIFGRKSFYMLGLSLFMSGSILCGLADSMTQLILFRGIQGLGAGFIIPITFTLVFTIMPKEKAGKYQAFYMSVFALSSVVGPSLGALITEHLDWRWNFYINLPVGLYIFIVLNRCLRDKQRAAEGRPSVDVKGALLLALTTLSILLALKMGGEQFAWLSVPIIGLILLGAIGLTLFLVVEMRVKEPILPPALFRSKVISATLTATFLQGMIMYGALLYIPLFVQGSMGGDVGDAGNTLTPMMFSIMIGATLSNFLLKRWTYRSGIIASMSMAGLGMLGMTYMPLDVHFWIMALVMLLIGIGIGILMPLAQMAVTYSAEDRFKGIATSTVGFSRSVGGVFGSAVLAAIVNNRLSSAVQEHAAEFNLSGEELASLADPRQLLSVDSSLSDAAARLLRQALGNSLQLGFWFLVIVAGLGIVAALWTGKARFETDELSTPDKSATTSAASIPGVGH
ncbi:MDR family MFS transporter [Cohnella silvisoli]|uniref:MDR family MFS transporter n=1 Tax=Cohnella silvisoli TaxID=2873699 RepID=A0ABV1KZW1_9BACL|nr:MDR family MFS transporter [Cohnella silvisoli]MCD9024684.1 MFS transporter [Cohnella silvisoli]